MACDHKIIITHGERSYELPCGKCPPCKIRKVNQWVFRLRYEERRSLICHFVTLTYDTDHVPLSPNNFKTLKKDDLQAFFKRLRNYTEHKIKYYAVGEYGSDRHRPHYHAIIYNVENTELYAKAWHMDGKQIGTVHVGKVTGASIAYTLKYIDKVPITGKFQRDDRVKEFSIMSKGLGDNYIEDIQNQNWHRSSYAHNYVMEPGGHRIALPKYYRDKLLDKEFREEQTFYIQQQIYAKNDTDRIKWLAQNHSKTESDYINNEQSKRRERERKFYGYQSGKRSVD